MTDRKFLMSLQDGFYLPSHSHQQAKIGSKSKCALDNKSSHRNYKVKDIYSDLSYRYVSMKKSSLFFSLFPLIKEIR